jgi:iron complex transport system substrate-binding protein
MRKPEQRFGTRRHRAVLDPRSPRGDAHDERFELRSGDGRVGWAWLRLHEQQVDAVGASDPDLPHAVRCWLAARGRFVLRLTDEQGRVLEQGPFSVDDLGDPPADAPARRLVTLAPSNAEVVDALGAFDRVLACEDSTDHPPQAARLPRLGPDLGPDLDRVAALSPDLVVSSLSVPGMERIVTGLRARGIPQVVLAPRSVADVMEDLRRVGQRLGLPERAEQAVRSMEQQVEALRRAQPATPVRIYLEWWPRPMFAPGRDTYAHELVAADPELCFVSWCGVAEDKLDPENLTTRPGLEQLAAARAGRVYRLDERFSGRPGPRMLEASRRMADVIARSGVRDG